MVLPDVEDLDHGHPAGGVGQPGQTGCLPAEVAVGRRGAALAEDRIGAHRAIFADAARQGPTRHTGFFADAAGRGHAAYRIFAKPGPHAYVTLTVRGYIVGEPVATARVNRGGFTDDLAIALADTAGEASTSKMVYVQLTTQWRSAWA